MKRFFIPLAALFSLVAPELTRAAPPIYPGVVPYEQLDTRNFELNSYPVLRIKAFMPEAAAPVLPVDTWSFGVDTNTWVLYGYNPQTATWHQITSSVTTVTINPTDNFSPYRIDALTFGDSAWYHYASNAEGFMGRTNMLYFVRGGSLASDNSLRWYGTNEVYTEFGVHNGDTNGFGYGANFAAYFSDSTGQTNWGGEIVFFKGGSWDTSDSTTKLTDWQLNIKSLTGNAPQLWGAPAWLQFFSYDKLNSTNPISFAPNGGPGTGFFAASTSLGTLGSPQNSPALAMRGGAWNPVLASGVDVTAGWYIVPIETAEWPDYTVYLAGTSAPKSGDNRSATNLFSIRATSGWTGVGTKVFTDNGTFQTASSVITGAISSQLLWTNSPTGGGSLTASSNVIASLPTGLYGSVFNNSEDIFAAGENAGQGEAVLQSTNLYNIGLLSGYGMTGNQAWMVMNIGDAAGRGATVYNSQDVYNFGIAPGELAQITNGSWVVMNIGDNAGYAMVTDKAQDIFNYGWLSGDSMGVSNSIAIFNYGDWAGKNPVSTIQNSQDIFNYGNAAGGDQIPQNSTNLFNYGLYAGGAQFVQTVNSYYNYGTDSGYMGVGLASNSEELYNYGAWAGASLAALVADGTFVNFTNVYNYGPEAGMQIKGTNATYILNYGYRAGEQSTMTGVSDLYNYGSDSGFQSTYDTSATDIYNYGTSAGKGASYTNSFFILNSGNSAGQSMVAQDSSSIVNLGSYAGANMVATNSSRIVNIGPYAGNLTTLTNSSYVMAYGDQALKASVLTNSSEVYANGYQTLYQAALANSSQIYAYGNSAGASLVGDGYTNIYLLGDNAQPTRKTNEISFGSASDKYTFRGVDGVWGDHFVATNNVLAFGADPTGVADSTAAIQAALDKGGYVYIPTGTYSVSQLVITNANQVLQGNGMDLSILKGNAAGTLLTVSNGLCHLRDFQVDGNFVSSVGVALDNAYFSKLDFVKIQDVKVDPGIGLYLTNNSYGVDVSRSIITWNWVGLKAVKAFAGLSLLHYKIYNNSLTNVALGQTSAGTVNVSFLSGTIENDLHTPVVNIVANGITPLTLGPHLYMEAGDDAGCRNIVIEGTNPSRIEATSLSVNGGNVQTNAFYLNAPTYLLLQNSFFYGFVGTNLIYDINANPVSVQNTDFNTNFVTALFPEATIHQLTLQSVRANRGLLTHAGTTTLNVDTNTIQEMVATGAVTIAFSGTATNWTYDLRVGNSQATNITLTAPGGIIWEGWNPTNSYIPAGKWGHFWFEPARSTNTTIFGAYSESQ